MDLRDYLRILRRGWPILLACVVLGLAAGVGITLLTTKEYQADTSIIVAAASNSSASDLNNGNTFTQDRVQSYVDIANSPLVTEPLIQKYDLPYSRQQFAAKISADAPLNKSIVNVHVTDTNPRTAMTLANEVVNQFKAVIVNLEQTDVTGRPVVKVTIYSPADLPTSPVSPNKVLDVGLGFVVGLLVGIGVIVLRDVLDNTVKGPEDFEDLDVPVLGMVPLDKRTQRVPVAFRGDPHSVRSEAYRHLRTNLQFVNVDDAPRVIAVTSAIPGEGKSTTAMNLAAALAEAGHRVCLVEADLRRPTIAKTLGLVPEVGFTTVLINKATLSDALQNAGRNLAVLTSGAIPPNPSELLISEQARSVIKAVSELVDYTIIDTAPLLPVADGAEVAAMADATLVVHKAGSTTHEQAARCIEALEKVGEKPVGVVLNMVSRGGGRSDYNYGYYYSYRPDRSHDGRGSHNGHRPSPESAQVRTAEEED